MQDGQHSIRARSISLGADGVWSKYRRVDISQKAFLSPGEAILIFVLGLLGAVLAIFGYVCLLRGYIARKRSALRTADQLGLELINLNADPLAVGSQTADAQVELRVPFVYSIFQEPDDVEHFLDADDVNLI